MSEKHRIVITGIGTVNPLAHSAEDFWAALLDGKLAPSENELFDASTYPTKFAAQVKKFNIANHLEGDSLERHKHAGRHCQFALAAATEAWKQSGLGSLLPGFSLRLIFNNLRLRLRNDLFRGLNLLLYFGLDNCRRWRRGWLFQQ